ncbi:hypothetical protein EBT31_19180 [bacterium]|nr:hypothetical protein [bacterium]
MSNHEITADWSTLLSQSKDTGSEYFYAALRTLEKSELKFTAADVIELAKIMADDFRNTSEGVRAQNLCTALSNLTQEIFTGLDNVVGVLADRND